MKTYENEVDELVKHLEQVIILATGGFGTGDAAEIKRAKAVLQLRGLSRKAMALCHAIASDVTDTEKVL